MYVILQMTNSILLFLLFFIFYFFFLKHLLTQYSKSCRQVKCQFSVGLSCHIHTQTCMCLSNKLTKLLYRMFSKTNLKELERLIFNCKRKNKGILPILTSLFFIFREVTPIIHNSTQTFFLNLSIILDWHQELFNLQLNWLHVAVNSMLIFFLFLACGTFRIHAFQ